MGATLASCHIRAETIDPIAARLKTLIQLRAYVYPNTPGWVSVFDEYSQAQGMTEIGRIARALSQGGSTVAIAFFVFDSDVLRYEVFDSGKLISEYNSLPTYWSSAGNVVQDVGVNPDALLPYSLPGVSRSSILELLAKKDILEERRLARLAQIFGIDSDVACATFDDFEPKNGTEATADQREVKLVEGKSFSTNANLLIAGAKAGDVKTVKELLAQGVSPNVFDKVGRTALEVAISGRHYGLVPTLIAGGAKPTAMGIITAALHGNLNVVKALIEAGADVSQKIYNGRDALVSAILGSRGNAANTLRFLISKGARVDETYDLIYMAPPRVERGMTALMYASRKGDVEAARVLIEAGADVNARAPEGATALTIAKAKGKLDIVALLRDAGATE